MVSELALVQDTVSLLITAVFSAWVFFLILLTIRILLATRRGSRL